MEHLCNFDEVHQMENGRSLESLGTTIFSSESNCYADYAQRNAEELAKLLRE